MGQEYQEQFDDILRKIEQLEAVVRSQQQTIEVQQATIVSLQATIAVQQERIKQLESALSEKDSRKSVRLA